MKLNEVYNRPPKEVIVICKECKKPEYHKKMRWLEGRYICRKCYRLRWERLTKKHYKWNDLDGLRPTMKEYREQEISKNLMPE